MDSQKNVWTHINFMDFMDSKGLDFFVKTQWAQKKFNPIESLTCWRICADSLVVLKRDHWDLNICMDSISNYSHGLKMTQNDSSGLKMDSYDSLDSI